MAPGKSRSQNISSGPQPPPIIPLPHPSVHSSAFCVRLDTEPNNRMVVLQGSVHIKWIPTHPHTSAVLLFKTHTKQTQSSQIMKEFWFFNFSSSLICCLKKSILCERERESAKGNIAENMKYKSRNIYIIVQYSDNHKSFFFKYSFHILMKAKTLTKKQIQ